MCSSNSAAPSISILTSKKSQSFQTGPTSGAKMCASQSQSACQVPPVAGPPDPLATRCDQARVHAAGLHFRSKTQEANGVHHESGKSKQQLESFAPSPLWSPHAKLNMCNKHPRLCHPRKSPIFTSIVLGSFLLYSASETMLIVPSWASHVQATSSKYLART